MGKVETRKKPQLGWRIAFLRLAALFCFLPPFVGVLNPLPCCADLLDLLEIPALVPGRDIKQNDNHPVAWKITWDEARSLTRSGDFTGAEKKYEQLFLLKNNLELARWEYGRLLLKMGEWEKAAATIELLVELAPNRVDYLNGLGLAQRKLGHFSRALDLFRKVHENNPDDLTALVGLAQGLVEVGRKKEAFPLFEIIFARNPLNHSIHRDLANLAFELGKLETARKLMMPLARGENADLDTLLMTARIYEGLKQDAAAARYWTRTLKYDPDNREARGRLALYFEKLGQPGRAMPHLLALLKNDEQNASLLSRICRIYIQTDRFAEALPYFEKYVLLQPDNLDGLMPVSKDRVDSGSDVISLYRRLLAVTPDDLAAMDSLASDLLRAGDSETALFMWEHVARLHPERVEIYQELGELLERLGRDERLGEVLEVLHRLSPSEIKVVSKLANLKVAQGDLLVGLEYYNKLEKAGYEGEDLFKGRGNLYEDLGALPQALADYKRLLLLQPNRHDIRRRCIMLAGKLGENLFLTEQVALLDAAKNSVTLDKDLLLAAQAFKAAHDFDQSLARYQRLILSRTESGNGSQSTGIVDPLSRQARLELADLYLNEGLAFEAEQLLRELYLAAGEQQDILKRLFDLALFYNNHNGEDARVWLTQYSAQNSGSGRELLMEARLLAASGDFDQAKNLLERLLYDNVAAVSALPFSSRNGEVVRLAGLLLVEVFIADDDLAKAERQCLVMLGSSQDIEIMVLLQKVYVLGGDNVAAANILQQLLAIAGDGQKLFELAGLFGKYGLVVGQVTAAEKILKNDPSSLAAAILLAEGWVLGGRNREAIKLLEDMATKYPENSSIILKMANYYYLNGQYASALQHSDRFLEKNPERMDANFLKAKCIVALGDHGYADNIIKQLFPIKTAELLEKKVAEAGLEVLLPSVKRTFLQLVTFTSVKRTTMPMELMSAHHMVNNSTRQKKELNRIAVPLYSRYRWEQEFDREVNR